VEELPFHLAILNSLAAYYVYVALMEKDKIKSAQYFEEATTKFNEADKINFHEETTWLGKGVLLLARRNFEAAAFQFNTVLQKSPSNIPALLGQACICFHLKDYSDALRKFATVLKMHPNSPPSIRLALGYCYHKLCYYAEAKLCFQRVLSLVHIVNCRIQKTVMH
jgi:RNA polymerase-associated protein CTR9